MADDTRFLTNAGSPEHEVGHLRVLGVAKRWGDRRVLVDVNFSVGSGIVATIAGGNGTGKTTLLRVASGLLKPEAGSVAFGGLDSSRDRRRYLARLGFLSAGDRGLYARLNARRHVDLAARLALMMPCQRRLAVEKSLQAFELDSFADRRVDRLSMGQRQRVRLAMTFVHDPDLVLLDEPANSLDAEGQQVLRRAVERAAARAAAIVVCVPEGEHTSFECDVKLRLVEGKLWQA